MRKRVGASAATARQDKAPRTETAKKPATRKKDGKLSCLDAAVKVLEEAKEPLGCMEMINRMHSKGYWTSDKATPQNTLYAAINGQKPMPRIQACG